MGTRSWTCLDSCCIMRYVISDKEKPNSPCRASSGVVEALKRHVFWFSTNPETISQSGAHVRCIHLWSRTILDTQELDMSVTQAFMRFRANFWKYQHAWRIFLCKHGFLVQTADEISPLGAAYCHHRWMGEIWDRGGRGHMTDGCGLQYIAFFFSSDLRCGQWRAWTAPVWGCLTNPNLVLVLFLSDKQVRIQDFRKTSCNSGLWSWCCPWWTEAVCVWGQI